MHNLSKDKFSKNFNLRFANIGSPKNDSTVTRIPFHLAFNNTESKDRQNFSSDYKMKNEGQKKTKINNDPKSPFYNKRIQEIVKIDLDDKKFCKTLDDNYFVPQTHTKS